MSILGIAVIFFPGTVIHEMSHAMTAGILHVPVGHMEFLPKIHGDRLRLGSVQVGESDFIRRFFIGTAPFFVGCFLLLLILWNVVEFNLLHNIPLLLISIYGVFVISNTMFSSKKDMEGAIGFFLFIVMLISGLYFLGVPFLEAGRAVFQNSYVSAIFVLGSQFLLVPIILDLILIGVLQVFIRR